MKEQNNNDMVGYRHPFGMTVRRKSACRAANDDHRFLATPATTAHLRATAYRDDEAPRSGGDARKSARLSSQQARGLLHLGRQYDVQARDNFAKEAVLFSLIIVVAVAWPAILSLRALAG
jgi:proline racemase